jgi:hypothetical protein
MSDPIISLKVSPFRDIIHSISRCIHYREQRKIEILERIWYKYLTLELNAETDGMRGEFEKILLRPNMLTQTSSPYYEIVSRA